MYNEWFNVKRKNKYIQTHNDNKYQIVWIWFLEGKNE